MKKENIENSFVDFEPQTYAACVDDRAAEASRQKNQNQDRDGDGDSEMEPCCRRNLAIVYERREDPLRYIEAYDMLRSLDEAKISTMAPVRPVGGDIYIFLPENAGDHNADCYRWCTSTGFHKLPKKAPIVERKRKKILTAAHPIYGDPGFVMYEYKLSIQPSPLLVHYVGNENIFKPFPHGNEKKNQTKDYFSTAASIRQQMKSSMNEPPQKIYKVMKQKVEARLHPAYGPRDLKQIQNFQCAQKRENRMGHDPLYSVYLLGFEFPGFVREYRASFEFENNLVFLTSRPLLDQLNTLLKPPPGVYDRFVEIYYDTTFSIGGFYLSAFSYRHYMLQGDPTIPCAYFIHQRKFLDDHLDFLRLVRDCCPNLASQPFAFITDREFRDVSSVLPTATHLFCWNHIQADVRQWERSYRHRGSTYQRKDTSSTYVKDIKRLLLASTRQEYEMDLLHSKKLWSDHFIKYFERSIADDLEKKAARFAVEDSGLCDEWSGITSNAAESLNKVLKSATGLSISMAEAILIFKNLSSYYDYEISCGRCCIGKYPLKSEFNQYMENLLDLGHPEPPIPTEDVVAFVKNELKWDAVLPKMPDIVVQDTALAGSVKLTVLDDSTEAHKKGALDSSVFFDKMKEKRPVEADTAQIAMAKELCRRGKVTVVPQRAAFVVENMESKKYCVTLFPVESCGCISESTCYHIIAARLSIGISDMRTKGRKNMGKMFQKSRKRPDRYTGKKKPKRRDYDKTEPKKCHQPELLESNENGDANGKKHLILKNEDNEEENEEPRQAASLATNTDAGPSSLDSHTRMCTNLELADGQSLDSIGRDVHKAVTAATQCISSNERKRRKKTKLNDNVHQEAVENTPDECLNKKQRPGMEMVQNRLPLMQRENSMGENVSSATAGKVEGSNQGLHCICRQLYDESEDMAECVRCNEWFHRRCVDIPTQLFGPRGSYQYWECDQCWELGVMKWGGELKDNESGQPIKLINTCPVDSVLTILHSYEKFDSLFVGQLRSRKPAEAALRKCLLSMREDQYVMAKWMWISYLKSASYQLNIKAKDGYIWYDLYAGVDDMIFQFFTDVWTVQFTITCSNRACTRRIWKHKSSHFTLRSEHRNGTSYDVVRALSAVVFNANNFCMANVKGTDGINCIGKLTVSAGNFVSKRPFMIPVDLSGIDVSQIPSLPHSFTFSGQRFVLTGVVIYSSQHFESLVFRRENWHIFDGFTNFKPLAMEELASPRKKYKANYAVYVRLGKR